MNFTESEPPVFNHAAAQAAGPAPSTALQAALAAKKAAPVSPVSVLFGLMAALLATIVVVAAVGSEAERARESHDAQAAAHFEATQNCGESWVPSEDLATYERACVYQPTAAEKALPDAAVARNARNAGHAPD